MAVDEKFEFESIQDSDTIKDYLQSLVEGMDKGKIVLSSDDSDLELHPGTLLKFEVKAKKKGDSAKLTLKISWRQPADEGVESDEMSIST